VKLALEGKVIIAFHAEVLAKFFIKRNVEMNVLNIILHLKGFAMVFL